MKKKIVIPVLVLAAAGVGYVLISGGKKKDEGLKFVEVKKGDIAERALAVGTLEPEQEIKVKSTIPGIVARVLFKVGDAVAKGSPLFEISPNPTPLEYVEARRAMEMAEIGMSKLQVERDRNAELIKSRLISACMFEYAITRSGCTAKMRSSLADENPLIFGFSARARAGLVV